MLTQKSPYTSLFSECAIGKDLGHKLLGSHGNSFRNTELLHVIHSFRKNKTKQPNKLKLNNKEPYV